MVSCFHCLIIIFCVRFDASNGYENLALEKHTWQKTIYTTHQFSAPSYAAVDGNRNQVATQGSCAMQMPAKTAEWRVDLGKVHGIDHLDIYFRHESKELWERYLSKRIAGFSLFVSNTTRRDDGILCFKESGSLQPQMSIQCVHHGRYVIYYNKQNVNLYLELCEVEIYDCPVPGFFGPYCNKTCPDNCQNQYCDHENGSCFSCNDGFQGVHCDHPCNASFYGAQCKSKCGNCLGGETCNPVSGTCVNRCDPGWQGDKCKQVCYNFWHGQHCAVKCGNCLDSKPCQHINGSCPNGCDPGWKNNDCKAKCDEFKYGEECSITCGSCLNKENCNHINGTCINGCDPGWQGSKCELSCDLGRYGSGCKKSCSDNCHSNSSHFCDHATGICTIGCKPGWQGYYCNMTCQELFYGEQCRNECGKCLQNQTCDHIDGTCPTGCDPGWQGSKCKAECVNGTYGLNCSQYCHVNCYRNSESDIFHHATGTCTSGCDEGWQGEMCNKFEHESPVQNHCTAIKSCETVLLGAIIGWIFNAIFIVCGLILFVLFKTRKLGLVKKRSTLYEDIQMKNPNDNHIYSATKSN